VPAACGTDAENAHVRLLGEIYLTEMHGILEALLFLEKFTPEIVSAHLQLSRSDPCLTDSLILHVSNIYSMGTGIQDFWSLLVLPLQ